MLMMMAVLDHSLHTLSQYFQTEVCYSLFFAPETEGKERSAPSLLSWRVGSQAHASVGQPTQNKGGQEGEKRGGEQKEKWGY